MYLYIYSNTYTYKGTYERPWYTISDAVYTYTLIGLFMYTHIIHNLFASTCILGCMHLFFIYSKTCKFVCTHVASCTYMLKNKYMHFYTCTNPFSVSTCFSVYIYMYLDLPRIPLPTPIVSLYPYPHLCFCTCICRGNLYLIRLPFLFLYLHLHKYLQICVHLYLQGGLYANYKYCSNNTCADNNSQTYS